MASWIDLYCFENNEERAKKILKKFGIEKYHFIIVNGILALDIEINLDNYRVEVNETRDEMLIRKRQVARRKNRHVKEYMRIVNSFNNDCLYNSLKFVAIDSGLYTNRT